MAQWSIALQSWESFCKTPAESIFSVPSDLEFNPAQFKHKMCTLNITALQAEFVVYHEFETFIQQVRKEYFEIVVHQSEKKKELE